jgi:hypothetical protein
VRVVSDSRNCSGRTALSVDRSTLVASCESVMRPLEDRSPECFAVASVISGACDITPPK